MKKDVFVRGKIKMVGVIIILMLGVTILFVSFAKAGLMITIKNAKEDGLGKIPVRLLIKDEKGEVKLHLYYLPEVRTLPISPFYKIKKLRDYLWINLCRQKNEKAKMALLLADKKIVEAQLLFINGYPKLAMSAARDGVEELEYAGWLWSGLEEKGRMILGEKIYRAGLAYEKVLMRAKGAMDVDQEEYGQIIKRLNDWNEDQKKKIY
ncbi:hypothetical protein CL634_07470 [bacterium]|nr:hypothetical protein [bacterium]